MGTHQLRWSPGSPYTRKVTLVILEKGLKDAFDLVETRPFEDETLRELNPLCKIPVLVLPGGLSLFGSQVAAEYVDSLTETPRFFPPAGPDRWEALKTMALADGVTDAAVLHVLEGRRPAEQQSAYWNKRYRDAFSHGLVSLDRMAARWPADIRHIGHIAAICTAGYLDMRFAHENWRATYLNLAGYYESVSSRPSVAQTKPPT